jgi:vacuolar-type H+-ATPase subunit F/Vma7
MSVVFLGSESSAAGYRLAGVDACVARAGAETAQFADARQHADLVMIEASVASQLPAAHWRAALAATTPLVVVVPDLAGDAPMPDLAARLRNQLGLAEDT